MTLAAAGCSSKSSPTTPTPSASHASVSITSISVGGSRAVEGGYGYRVVLHLRESGGMAATIKSVDLTFMDGSNAIMTSHFEQMIPATGNITPANGVADTRELVATDANLTHPYAGSVNARVTYTEFHDGRIDGHRIGGRSRAERTAAAHYVHTQRHHHRAGNRSRHRRRACRGAEWRECG